MGKNTNAIMTPQIASLCSVITVIPSITSLCVRHVDRYTDNATRQLFFRRMFTSVLNRHKSVTSSGQLPSIVQLQTIRSSIGDMSALCEVEADGASCEPSQSAGPPPPPHPGADHCSCV